MVDQLPFTRQSVETLAGAVRGLAVPGGYQDLCLVIVNCTCTSTSHIIADEENLEHSLTDILLLGFW